MASADIVKARPMPVRRNERFASDHTRVITQLFLPSTRDRTPRIIRSILGLSPEQANAALEEVMANFANRHRDISRVFRLHYQEVQRLLTQQQNILHAPTGDTEDPAWVSLAGPESLIEELSAAPEDIQLLVGAYFTKEYSVEAAAFFNPSMVPHPDQSELPEGHTRFILSFRAVGEGHLSSIVFRSGVVDETGHIGFDPVSPYVSMAEVVPNPTYEKKLFVLKLKEMGFHSFTTGAILGGLPTWFSYQDLLGSIEQFHRDYPEEHDDDTIRTLRWLAESNYELRFDDHEDLSERVIFPVSENDRKGIEDARFVRFEDDDGTVTYYATFTAYNGITYMPELIETDDFKSFRILTLNGRIARNKGMALFPRRINGQYHMVTRHDGETMFVSKSENLHFWHDATVLQVPTEPWELVQLGNCGSPLETSEGWLLLTHGVGPMRRYCLGALLLDLEDPSKVIGRLREPLISPTEMEREGYVPNVVYSCGGMIHQDQLILPYAMSDTASALATVDVQGLVSQLKHDGV